MPAQKDFKRLVRARMQKTGESYTAARLQLIKRPNPEPRIPTPNYAALAGMSDSAITAKTGRSWAEWVAVLDRERAAEKPHREIARFVASLGTPDWWTQTVTVGYERIKGLREKGQRRDGGYEASKSRTFNVPIRKLFAAFSTARTRRQWLEPGFTIRSSTAPKRMRVTCTDNTVIQVGFFPKGTAKSMVAVQHQNLADRSAVAASKKAWAERFDRLGAVIHSVPRSG
jgi:hypothetical protein